MQKLSAKQLWLLVLLTVVWGLNWPVMKLGVTGMPPLQFRTMSIWLGLMVVAIGSVLAPTKSTTPTKKP